MNVKAKKLIEDFMGSNDEFRKVKNIVTKAKEAMNIPKIELPDILRTLNKDKILKDQEIEVSGYLSNIAYFDFPCTYITKRVNEVSDEKTYKWEINGKGEVVKKRIYPFKVKALYPPVLYNSFSEKDEMLCFLYQDPNCMKIDVVFDDNGYSIKMNDRNKYIPVLVDQRIFQKYKHQHIRAIASVNVMSKTIENMFSENNNTEYQKLVEYFYDPNYNNFTAIYLSLREIAEGDSSVIEKVYHNYGLEFSFFNQLVSEETIEKKLSKQ